MTGLSVPVTDLRRVVRSEISVLVKFVEQNHSCQCRAGDHLLTWLDPCSKCWPVIAFPSSFILFLTIFLCEI